MPAPLSRLLCCRLISAAQAWAEVWGTHKVGGSEEGGAAIALNAGIDQEGSGNSAINTLAQGIADGKTTKDGWRARCRTCSGSDPARPVTP